MVTINATLLVELILFLVFLWGTQRYILTPVLKNMDERTDSIENDHAQAESNTTASVALEKKYRHEIAVIRKNADAEVREATQKSQLDHSQFLTAERDRAEQAVAEVRQEAKRQVESQRDTIAADIPDLAKRIQSMLAPGGDA